ncbi:glycosyltransferase family 2 protein [Clostridium tetani]|uniref:Succinoglycan biosynthesis protein exoA n=1 Tax=Clostridium tetani (strain Massachusetts / E88) TaxID=212717 RepID=Q891V5_CLOTE|nr:glycosyltransferase family 2 protein [Clostridium tetani]AAO36740.1 succinoglycan biosynthesis protein exoA [Clostridium tetani E88]AVP53972.1 glycosyltransferase family 2 protein [Clostridium tetani]KGI41126.1 succinoglycan biosynthesis protein exoa [Clostridium tetani]KGI45187.1 succinoglycan biosynthesis protein exoa [Clostridium tetani]KGI45874.1 succinoglycan biosynthesis protein exoa [Clostridium tetani]
MNSKNDLTVSVVIPCRNEKNYIRKCIDSFLNQSYPKDLYEILICDGMSDDGTRDIIREYEDKHNNVKLIDNRGLSAPKGMNEGIRYSKKDAIIIFGAHAYADKDFILENIKALTSNEVGCVGGPIETINENNKGASISMAMSSPFGVGNALFRYAQEETFVDTVAFGCYRKEVLNEIGYFDEELVRNQDDELNFRVIKNGYKILLSPKIKSYYYSRSSLKKLWKQYYQYGFWKVRVMQKHGKPASLRHLVPATFVITNILGGILSLFNKYIFYLWMLELALYVFCDIIFSFKLIKKNKNIKKHIFFIFPILHMSYGIGFVKGLFNFYIFKSKKAIEKNTKMSR